VTGARSKKDVLSAVAPWIGSSSEQIAGAIKAPQGQPACPVAYGPKNRLKPSGPTSSPRSGPNSTPRSSEASGTPEKIKPLILANCEGALWKILEVCDWRDEEFKVEDFDFNFGLIDVQTFGCRWLYGEPPFDREMFLWFAPSDMTPLNAMEVIALAATDDFDLEWVLSL